jgi:hypothetical protein
MKYLSVRENTKRREASIEHISTKLIIAYHMNKGLPIK